jgi:hypothetical protein
MRSEPDVVPTAHLPIRRLTLYRHGVALVERSGVLSGSELHLSFPASAMDDVLKSLVITDATGASVSGIEVERAEDRTQRLQEERIALSDDRSFLDLLRDLRGHTVTVTRHGRDAVTGTVLGIDVRDEDHAETTVAVVVSTADGTTQVVPISVSHIAGVGLSDQSSKDVERVLSAWKGQDSHRSAIVRLSPGEHDLRVAHLLPSAAWRVSYRIVVEADGKLLLQGWGLFDNTFDDDLDGVEVTLVTGMPVSFRYRLYQGRIPERPFVEDRSATMAAPVEFASMAGSMAPMSAPAGRFEAEMMDAAPAMRMAAPAPAATKPRAKSALTTADMHGSIDVAVSGSDRGALFAYVAQNPVSAGRGRSVLVPLISTPINGERVLLYKAGSAAAGNPPSPMVSITATNSTGLTLERGPVTVLEHGSYGGEAIVEFTPPGGTLIVPFAVELGIRVAEMQSWEQHVVGLRIENRYARLEEHHITIRMYTLHSTLAVDTEVVVEHELVPGATLVDSPTPEATGEGTGRWKVTVPAGGEAILLIKESAPNYRYEHVGSLDGDRLRTYLQNKALTGQVHASLEALLAQYRRIEAANDAKNQKYELREKTGERQDRARENLAALSDKADEADLRRRYVGVMSDCEDRMADLDAEIEALDREVLEIEAQINAVLDEIGAAT